jgi:UDP-N-acetylglucosamine 3-dehydrogenase
MHPCATVVGTVDPAADPEGGAASYRSLDAALDAVQGLDAAIVATPTVDHAASARTLLERGIPVLVEKPLASTVEDAAGLAAIAQASGTLLVVGHVERFNPAVRLVHSLLRRGDLGRPIALAFRRVGLPPLSPVGVDVIHDLAVHDIDVFGLLAGMPPELEAASGWCAEGLVESAHLLLRANGVSGLVQVNWRTPVRLRDFTLTTDECYLEVNYTTQLVETVRAAEAPEIADFHEFQQHYGTPHRVRLECRPAEPLVEQLGAFLAAVEIGETDPLLAQADDGLHALALAYSAGQAIRSGDGACTYGRVRAPTFALLSANRRLTRYASTAGSKNSAVR